MAENPQLAVTTHEHFVKNVVEDGVLQKNVLLERIKSKGKMHYSVGGTQIGPGVMRARQHSVSGWGSMVATDIPQPDLFENWSHQWGGKIAQFYVDEWDNLANHNKSEALIDMMDEQETALQEDFAEDLEDNMFTDRTGNNPAQWGGLASFIKKTGTYGGLSQASGNAIGNKWKAQVIPGTGSISGADFDSAPGKYLSRLLTYLQIGKSGNNRPDFIITTREGYLKYSYMVQDLYKVENVDKKLRAMGHDNFVWQGVPVVWSDSCPTNKFYAVNAKKIHMYCQTSKLLVPRTYDSHNPFGKIFAILTKSQIVCTNPRVQGAISSTLVG